MDTLLTNIDRFTTSLKPLNRLLERVIEKIVPHQEARAACWGYRCASVCTGTCKYGQDVRLQSLLYYTSDPGCLGPTVCTEYRCDNCVN